MNGLFDFVSLTLVKAAPLIFAALGGVICERAGILNIALEGQLTIGAFTGVAVSFATGNPILGLLAAVIAGALGGMLLGFAATRFGVDQIVAGTGINLLALGGAAFGLTVVFGQPGASSEVHALGSTGEYALIIAAFVAALLLHVALYKTPWGLRTRASGENPRTVRLIATAIGGGLAGLGGVYLSLGELDLYSDGMTAGRGFIALAAVIFGRWTPLGATGAAVLFGALSALQFALQRTGVPSELMQALPYLAALAALTGIAGRARAPQADGVPYTE
jgi:simple sugar transport system permease protein